MKHEYENKIEWPSAREEAVFWFGLLAVAVVLGLGFYAWLAN